MTAKIIIYIIVTINLNHSNLVNLLSFLLLLMSFLNSEKDTIIVVIALIIKNIENGFCYDKYLVLTEKELLNKKEEKYEFKSNFKIGTKIRDISKLEIGDYVVHYKYGIGRYNGLKTLKKGDLTKEYLMVEYAGTDKLYIPVEKIDSIKKYSNSDASAPRLNKLNSSEWSKVKAKAKARAEDIAESLLKLYALREATPGYAFQKDNETQLEFEKEFPYTETSDQLKVIKEIKKENRPIEKMLRFGPEALTNEELLAILINTGTKNKSSLDISYDIINSVSSLADILSLSLDELQKFEGIKETKACRIEASFELTRRLLAHKGSKIQIITTFDSVKICFTIFNAIKK